MRYFLLRYMKNYMKDKEVQERNIGIYTTFLMKYLMVYVINTLSIIASSSAPAALTINEKGYV